MRRLRAFTGVAAVLLASALPLAGCGRAKASGAKATMAAAAGQPSPSHPATLSSENQPGDPCPSIGTLAETRGGPIALNGPRMVRLKSVCTSQQMTAHLRTYGDGTRFILVADDLRVGVQPGALFQLRLGPPSTGEAAVIGTLNFFAANRPAASGQPHSISYDVTRQIAALSVSGWPAQGLGVAIAPSMTPAPGSNATIGALRLVAQAPS